jgi:DNA-binding transcriptional LysR family regulator
LPRGRSGSFTAAANTAGVTPAAVSRSISRLEKRLGVRLFVRSTRSIRLTEGGRSYFEQCRGALNQLIEAERKVTGEQVQPSGTLRISAPTTYGHYRLLPLLPALRERFPLLRFEVQIGNRNIDFHEENFDVAIRFRAQPDSTMVSRHLEDAELVVVASPGYLKRAGRPQALEDCSSTSAFSSICPAVAGRLRGCLWMAAVNGRCWPRKAIICAPRTCLPASPWPGPAPVCSKPTASNGTWPTARWSRSCSHLLAGRGQSV